jgi:hypothetical protein
VAPHVLKLCLPSNTGLSSTDFAARLVRAVFSWWACFITLQTLGFARMVCASSCDYIGSAFRALRSQIESPHRGLFFCPNASEVTYRAQRFDVWVLKEFHKSSRNNIVDQLRIISAKLVRQKNRRRLFEGRLTGMSRGVNVPRGRVSISTSIE